MKDQHKTRLNVTNNLRIIPGDSEDVEIGVNFMYFDTPVYWSLPRQFLGDKVKNTFYVTRISSMNGHTIVTVRGEKSCTNFYVRFGFCIVVSVRTLSIYLG